MTSSLLIFHYGQSNADCHDAGPSFDAPCLRDPRIVVPNDGAGFRGLFGRPRKVNITGFEPAFADTPNVQSIGHAAAARYLVDTPDTAFSQIIVRSGAKGGRPLCGFVKDARDIYGIYLGSDGELSPLILDMFEDIHQICTAAKKNGAPVTHVVIPFFHGEADRATPRDIYTLILTEMMNVVEAHLAKMDLPVTWMMTQASGTGGGYAGNAWENRMSVFDICDTRANAHFASANYAYQLMDAAHLNATSKALIGEMLGLQIKHALQGTALPITKLREAAYAGHHIELTFDSPHGISLATDEFPTPHTPHGFQIKGHSKQAITQVEQIGSHQLRLHCALPVCQSQGELRYAYFINRKQEYEDDTQFPLGRGSLCDDWVTASAIVPGRRVLRWAPGFALPLSKLAQNALAA